MNFIYKRIIFCLILCGSVLAWGEPAGDGNKSKDINSDIVAALLEGLKSEDSEMRIKSCRRIYEFGGFRDEQLFDFIAERVQKNYRNRQKSGGKHLDEYAWYVKALTASGNEKYLSLVKMVSESSNTQKLRKYARSALEWDAYFKEWNTVMREVPFDSASNDIRRVNAYKTLLGSENPEIKKAVYRRIYDYSGIQDASLYEIIVNDIKSDMKNGVQERTALDQFAWKLKALSASGNVEYEAVINEASVLQLDTKESQAKLDKYTNAARENLIEFSKWNAVQAHTENEVPGRSPRMADWMDYLQFGDTRMQIYAVRQAFGYDVYDEEFHNTIVAKLGDSYKDSTRNNTELDFQAWVCRWLGEHQSAESRALLMDINNKTGSKKVRGYARKALALYK